MTDKKPIFIAEIKTQSPFGVKNDESFHSLMTYAIKYGDWVSVHTNPLWGGSFEAIEYVRRFTDKPILAKGIHSKNDDIQKALDYGANKVLVVDRLPHNLLQPPCDGKVIFELSNLINIEKVSYDFIQWGEFLYNGRDLSTGLGKKSIADYAKYREKFNWLCGASLIKSPDDVQSYYPNCDAFIVGTNLVEFCDKLKKK